MVEGRCRYSLQWRVSGRLKEQGELNNAQHIEWEKYLWTIVDFLDYCVNTLLSSVSKRRYPWTFIAFSCGHA